MFQHDTKENTWLKMHLEWAHKLLLKSKMHLTLLYKDQLHPSSFDFIQEVQQYFRIASTVQFNSQAKNSFVIPSPFAMNSHSSNDSRKNHHLWILCESMCCMYCSWWCFGSLSDHNDFNDDSDVWWNHDFWSFAW